MKGYAGFPGTAPDPMQATLQRGPILSAYPELYIALFEAAERKIGLSMTSADRTHF
jgi:hypothetical protein